MRVAGLCCGRAAPASDVVINVLAEQATMDGDSEAPGFLPGYGPVPAPVAATLTIRSRFRLAPPTRRIVKLLCRYQNRRIAVQQSE